jgi:predicted metalloprotease with PDZ domain
MLQPVFPAFRPVYPFSLAILVLALLTGLHLNATAEDDLSYHLKYQLEFQPEAGTAKVKLLFDKGRLLRHMNFANQPGRLSNIKANGTLTITDNRVMWDLPEEEAWLTYTVKINHERDPGEFDALMTKQWALFRGDDVFPAAQTNEVAGAYAIASLDVILPEKWSSVETGWPRRQGTTFTIDNPERLFDRPTGWMIAGELGTRRTTVSKTSIAVSAPKGSELRRMEVLTFLNFVWPEVKQAFESTPGKLLVTGMGDPMWRGGLSASNSLFLHADRPLVSENGTSPLLHELVHMVTRISGVKTDITNDDWIAEGLAEFYSFELLYRAGGMTKNRRKKIIANLAKWGEEVKNLRAQPSIGPVTAQAVVLLADLDKEIRRHTNNKASLDNVTRDLMIKRKVSLQDLRESVEGLMGKQVVTLRSPLVN